MKLVKIVLLKKTDLKSWINLGLGLEQIGNCKGIVKYTFNYLNLKSL